MSFSSFLELESRPMADELPDGDTLRILVLTDSHARVLSSSRSLLLSCFESYL